MMLFWIVMLTMVIIALAAIAPTLLRQQALRTLDRDGQNVDIARERLASLEIARQQGTLSQEEYLHARQELEQALLIDLERGEEEGVVAPGSGRSGRMALWALVIVVPLLTVLIYLYVGSPQLIGMTGGHQAGAPASMEEMILSLQQRLEQNPDDPNGWFMLGRSYMATEQYPQAASAFDRVNQLVGGEEPAVLLALANALILSRQGDMAGRPTELVRKAVKLAPDSSTALWLAGAVEKVAGNNSQALAHWRKLLPMLQDDPESEQRVRAMISELESKTTTK
jgi:cytochrome c-type biogenesis protein CcmH